MGVKTQRALLGLVAVVAVLCVFIGIGATGKAHSWPCNACHEPLVRSEAGADAAHDDVVCASCHSPVGWQASINFAFALPRMLVSSAGMYDGGAREFDTQSCLRCHDVSSIAIPKDASPRYDHKACRAVETGCLSCHSFEHGDPSGARMFPMEDCVTCHTAEGAPAECDTCHVGRSTRQRLDNGPWQTTHGTDWEQLHGTGSIAWCRTCHPEGYCVRCHGVDLPHPVSFGRTHGKDALEAGVNSCTERCHDRAAFCDDCHGIEMPHPDTFLARHSTEASGTEDIACTSCHNPDDCVACHVKHTHPGSTDGTLGGEGGVIAP